MLEYLKEVSSNNIIVAAFLFIGLRAIAIIVPPFLGIAIDLLGISLFGWFLGFVYAEIGIMIGAICAFSMARSGRNALINMKSFKNRISPWISKLPQKNTLRSWIILRLVSNFAFDWISYAAGFSGVEFRNYCIATLLGNIPSMLFFYYFAGRGMESGNLILTMTAISLFLALIYFIHYIYFRRARENRAKRNGSV